MQKQISRLIKNLEDQPLSLWSWLTAFSSLVIIRIFLENLVMTSSTSKAFFYEIVHYFLFFFLTYSVFTLFLGYFLKIEMKKISNIALFGFLIILLPPIIDYFFCGRDCWRTYEFEGTQALLVSAFTFFGQNVSVGATVGVKMEIILALILIFTYAHIKTEKILKAGVIVVISYAIFFLLAFLPTFAVTLINAFEKRTFVVSADDIFQYLESKNNVFFPHVINAQAAINIKMSLIICFLLLVLIGLYLILNQRQKLFAFLRNARYPQLLVHWGLIVIGMGLAWLYTKTKIEINIFNLLAFALFETAIACAWLASVVFNDIADENTDKITPNKIRPLITGAINRKEFLNIGLVLLIASFSITALISLKAALFLAVYQAVAWIYSVGPLRLKRLPFVSTFLSSVALLLILFSGYVSISPEQNLQGLPLPIIAMLIIVFTLSLPVKDLKDIEGDKKEGVYTIPVLFGKHWGKIIIGTGIFISFLLSVIFFQEIRLFWWATIFGGIAFFIIMISGKNKAFAYEKLPWWIFGLVFVYGLVLVKIVFI